MSGMLPKGWVETTFPHVALLNPKSSLDDDTEVAFVPMPHVPTNFSDTLRFEKKLWGDVKRGFTHFRNDDVIFAKITPCFENGKAAIVSGLPNSHGAGSTEFYVLRPVIVPSALLFYWVKTAAFLKTAEAHMTGTVGQKRVPKTFVESHPFPLPPLNEQKRIVAKLDAIMPRIDSAKERLEKIPAILKRFRQSVLTAAVTGKLTEKWREEHPEIESAEVLLSRIGKARWNYCGKINGRSLLKKKGGSAKSSSDHVLSNGTTILLPTSWEVATPEEISSPQKYSLAIGPFGSNLKVSDYRDSGVPIVFVRNIRSGDFLKNRKYVSEEKAKELIQHAVYPGDLLITKMGDPPGDCCVYASNLESGIITSDCLKFTPWSEFIERRYCKIAIDSFLVRDQLIDITQGVAQQKISLERFKSIRFPLPPLEEQKEIVRQVDKLFSLADKVEEHYQKARARVDTLAQSVLAKAFRGELVPQDPDDEPAEKLLQRIQEEKAKMETELKNASRSARGTRRNGSKTQRIRPEEKQTGEP